MTINNFEFETPPKNMLLWGDLKIEVLENLEERNNTAKINLKGNFPFFKTISLQSNVGSLIVNIYCLILIIQMTMVNELEMIIKRGL